MAQQWYTETELVRLPAALARVVGEAVKGFAEKHNLQVHARWHDADLWIVYSEQANTIKIDGRQVPAFIQTRVTIGAFSGQTGFDPELVFMPDILISTSHGRFLPPPNVRSEVASLLPVSVQKATTSELSQEVWSYLRNAWTKAENLREYPKFEPVFLP